MHYIQGKERQQAVLFPPCLDQIIAAQSDVRFIDLFAESIAIADFNFVTKQSVEGRPAYHPIDLLKLFIYGYLNGIRSSGTLEKQCHINLCCIINLVDKNLLKKFLRELCQLFFTKMAPLKRILMPLLTPFILYPVFLLSKKSVSNKLLLASQMIIIFVPG